MSTPIFENVIFNIQFNDSISYLNTEWCFSHIFYIKWKHVQDIFTRFQQPKKVFQSHKILYISMYIFYTYEL